MSNIIKVGGLKLLFIRAKSGMDSTWLRVRIEDGRRGATRGCKRTCGRNDSHTLE